MKQCKKCLLTKPLSDFYPKENSFTSRCKVCEKEVCRERAKIKYHLNLADARKKTRDSKRKQYAESGWYGFFKFLASQKWRAKNPAKFKAMLRKYYENNRPVFIAARHRRRARLVGNGGSFTSKEWTALLEACGHACLCCGNKEPDIKLTVDHVVPLCRGGVNSIVNIQPLCMECNKNKFTKTTDYRKGDK